MSLGKILPVGGFVIAVALVGITSGFSKAPKASEEYWTLKPNMSVGSTNPADYERKTLECDGAIHFCGFVAPEDGTTGEPDIDAVPSLTDDLEALQSNPNSQTNSSGALHYEDQL